MDSTKDNFWRQLPPLENLSTVYAEVSFQQAPFLFGGDGMVLQKTRPNASGTKAG